MSVLLAPFFMMIFKADCGAVPHFDALYDVHDWAVEKAFRDRRFGAFRDKLSYEIARVEGTSDCLDSIVGVLQTGVGLTVDDLRTMGFWWRKPSNVWWKLRQRGYDLVAVGKGKRSRRYYLREWVAHGASC